MRQAKLYKAYTERPHFNTDLISKESSHNTKAEGLRMVLLDSRADISKAENISCMKI